jgi:hypothetical protein
MMFYKNYLGQNWVNLLYLRYLYLSFHFLEKLKKEFEVFIYLVSHFYQFFTIFGSNHLLLKEWVET